MAISVGEALPAGEFLRVGENGPESVSIAALTAGKTVVMFGLPGAYTRTCTAAHLPSFIRTAPALREKGVDEIICFSVNDPFVMSAWADDTSAGAAGIHMLADGSGAFTKAIGMDFTAEPVGFYGRSKRHAMVVKDGTVTILNVDENPGECNLSAGETILDALS
ncbi:MAG: peroxiredoxin [Pseudomonadota bacterium]